MKKLILTAFLVLSIVSIVIPSEAAVGVVDVKSAFNFKETATRMERILRKKGMTIFNIIKHSDSAAKIGIKLRNTELIIFGNPKVGSPLMKCQQSTAIDLPQKALIWEDEEGSVWITYNDPAYLQKRHNITGCEKVLLKIKKALAGLAKAAAVE